MKHFKAIKAPRMTLPDRVISWFSAEAGFRRLRYRTAMNAFEAAGRGPRFKERHVRDSSINSDTRRALPTLRARTRHLAQNNSWAAAAHRELANNIVAGGITPHTRLTDAGRREQWETELKAWFDTTACDYDGRHNFYGLQRLIGKTVVESGECLVIRRRVAGRRLPLQLQVLEPDHIDSCKDGIVDVTTNTKIVQGVEYRNGRVVAYWLFPEHPGDTVMSFRAVQSVRVPATEVIHVYRIDRPGQARGVPWGAPCVVRLWDWDDYADAQLVRQKIAACFAVLWSDPSGEVDEEDIAAKVSPGMMQRLPGEVQMEFGNPPPVDKYDEYGVMTAHEIAAGYGIPYSVMTGDVRQTNFSSGRMADRHFNRNVKSWQDDIMITGLCEPVAGWFVEAQLLTGRFSEGALIFWQKPKREMTDPAREIPPIIAKVRAGLCTLPEAIREEGYDPDDVLAEIQKWNQLLDEMGIILDSDPRKVSAAGLTQAKPAGTELPWDPPAADDD